MKEKNDTDFGKEGMKRMARERKNNETEAGRK